MLQQLDDHLKIWGGESFIQLVTGVNFGFFALQQANSRHWFNHSKGRTIVLALMMQLNDDHSEWVGGLFAMLLGLARGSHDFVFEVCRWLSLILGFVGLWALYVGGNCSYSIFLLGPAGVYLLAGNIALLILWGICRFVRSRVKNQSRSILQGVQDLRNDLK